MDSSSSSTNARVNLANFRVLGVWWAARYFSNIKAGLVYKTNYVGTEAEYAIAVRKGDDELRLQINAQVAKLEADGTLADFRRRWFGTPDLLIA
jgi:ABC-type amino acid transport substrate-binding protein